MLLVDPVERVTRDLLEAERQLRRAAEAEVGKLRRLLRDTGYILDGAALEVARHKDPHAPDNWTSKEWSAFLDNVNRGAVAARRGWASADPEELRHTIEALRAEAAQMKQKMMSVQASAGAAIVQSTAPVKHAERGGAASPLEEKKVKLSPDFVWPSLPPKPPVRFASRFKNWERERLALAVIASGRSIRKEAQHWVVTRIPGVASGESGSIKRMFESLEVEAGLLVSRKMEMAVEGLGETALIVTALTAEGRDLCRACGWEPVETEHERLLRLHQGETQNDHTLANLVFVWHARKRGYAVDVLPEVPGNAEPDLKVEKDGASIFVEVELGERKQQKWKNVAALQGFVGVCARDKNHRLVLESEIKALGLSGRSTDIPALVLAKETDPPLFPNSW